MSEIDPELEARWRAASREVPPSALDDAIRAAARREVGAKPGVFRAAPRWLPLAAAATVAAIAVGIVQMTPPEEVTPTIPPPLVATLQLNKAAADKPAGNAPQAPLREAPAAAGGVTVAPAPAPVPASAPQASSDAVTPSSNEQKRNAAGERDRDALARNRTDTFAAAPEPKFQEKAVAGRQAPPRRAIEAQQRAEDEAPEREQSLKQKTEIAAASSAMRARVAAQSPRGAAGARNELQPELQSFPAAPKPTEARTANAQPATPPPVAAPAPAPMAAPAPATATAKLAAESSATGRLSGSADAKDTANAAPAPAQVAGAFAKKSDPGSIDAPERRKDLAPLAPDEWIKRIRRLIAEGRTDDAVKELAAFRREYKERSDALLPSDLRTFKP